MTAPARDVLVPLPAIVVDAGGTNARFAIVDEAGRLGPAVDVRVRQFPDAVAAMEAAIGRLGVRPRSAVLAVAGVIMGDSVALTNAHWVFEPYALMTALGMTDVVILNDFEAIALGLPALTDADTVPIGGGTSVPGATRVVVGPGTGLGAAALLGTGRGWTPTHGEGGHTDIGPRTEREYEIWPHLERIDGRTSAEWLISGGGLLRLHRGVAAASGFAPAFDDSAALSKAALAGDPKAEETLRLFVTLLGRYAGDVALMFLPHGGVFIAGGIAPKIAPFFHTGAFREAFVDKAPHRAVMETIPTRMVVRPDPGLLGLGAFVAAPQDYALNLAGRHWQRG
ncbi:MAG: ROK family protein [Bauldia sp.]|nr:ROK family protein [Bauldia sp.]